MRATAGDVLGGRYRLTARIAVGGMGEVWRARDDVLGRDVAVKLLKEEYTGHPGFLDRFRAEARHTAALGHPNIAAIYDYGEADGSAYLVMELVPGEALSDLLDREGPLPADRALRLLAQAAAGLAAAHAAGVVHRDVKPGNLLVTGDGTVKVTDFGIARAADATPLTATGQVMGTAQYLAPEQAMGHAATPASDVYALGVVTHEVLTGARPFDGDVPVAVAMAHVNSEPPPLPETVPPGVRALVAACLAKDPAARPQDGAAFARAATSLATGDEDGARRALPPPAAPTTRVLGGSTPTLPEPAPALAEPGAGAGPQPGPVPPHSGAPSSSRRARRRLTGPLVALLALLGFVLVGAVLAGNPFGDGQPPVVPQTEGPADTGAGEDGEQGEPPDPGTEAVEVREARYLGMDADAARDALERLGLEVEEVEDEQADAPRGTVVGITEGTFQPGETVTLVVADPGRGDAEDPGQQPGTSPPASPGQDGDTGPDGPGTGSPGAGSPGDDDGEDN